MIKKLKKKFILICGASLLSLLLIMMTLVNFINFKTVVKNADEVLSIISINKGTFPGFNVPDGESGELPDYMSPELPYETRYFSVLIDNEGQATYTDTTKISSIDKDKAIEYANIALGEDSQRGFIGNFRYLKSTEENLLRITFLDCGSRLDYFYIFLSSSFLIAATGFFVVMLFISVFSGRVIRPIAESYEKQKRFITDAGHEIKTPLTVINANVDLLEMEIGENESLIDIQQQTKRLYELTNDLVFLAKMEETGRDIKLISFPVSEIARETVDSFVSVATMQKKTISSEIIENLSLRGNEKAIIQLISVFLDNAIKYSPESSNILFSLSPQKSNIVITVKNTVSSAVSQQDIDRIFDRFYRADSSRNSTSGGYGIGLSIAKAIVDAHSGKISASIENESIFKITAILPM